MDDDPSGLYEAKWTVLERPVDTGKTTVQGVFDTAVEAIAAVQKAHPELTAVWLHGAADPTSAWAWYSASNDRAEYRFTRQPEKHRQADRAPTYTWCEACQDHYVEDHWEPDIEGDDPDGEDYVYGGHKVGMEYGPTGRALVAEEIVESLAANRFGEAWRRAKRFVRA